MLDYYELLNVPCTATQHDIRQAYKSQALKFHPDKSTRVDATHAFQTLQEAYSTLHDPLKRRVYDRTYKQRFYVYESCPNQFSYPENAQEQQKPQQEQQHKQQQEEERERRMHEMGKAIFVASVDYFIHSWEKYTYKKFKY